MARKVISPDQFLMDPYDYAFVDWLSRIPGCTHKQAHRFYTLQGRSLKENSFKTRLWRRKETGYISSVTIPCVQGQGGASHQEFVFLSKKGRNALRQLQDGTINEEDVKPKLPWPEPTTPDGRMAALTASAVVEVLLLALEKGLNLRPAVLTPTALTWPNWPTTQGKAAGSYPPILTVACGKRGWRFALDFARATEISPARRMLYRDVLNKFHAPDDPKAKINDAITNPGSNPARAQMIMVTGWSVRNRTDRRLHIGTPDSILTRIVKYGKELDEFFPKKGPALE